MITTLLFTERKGPKGGGRQNCSHLPLKQEDITHSFYDPISADNGNREVYYVMVIMIHLSVRKIQFVHLRLGSRIKLTKDYRDCVPGCFQKLCPPWLPESNKKIISKIAMA